MSRKGKQRLVTRFLAFLLAVILATFTVGSSFSQEKQTVQYSESAIRRFEIITLMSLPFTSIHSYIMVRAVEMIRQGKIFPNFTDGDWRAVQIGAVAMALFVGVWDWLHTRSVDRNEPRVPNLGGSEDKSEGGRKQNFERFPRLRCLIK